MNKVQELITAAVTLSAEERIELIHWLDQSDEVRKLRLEELRKDIRVGIAQADRGELLDGERVIERPPRRTSGGRERMSRYHFTP